MKLKHILTVSPFFYPTNTFQQNLSESLVNSYSDIKITVVCYRNSNLPLIHNYKNHPLIKVYQIPSVIIFKDQFLLPNYFLLFKTINSINKKERIDLITCETRFFDSALWVPLIAKKYKIPSVLVDHASSAPHHSSPVVNFIASFLDHQILPFILKKFTKIAVSNKAVFQYLKNFHLKNIVKIGTGVDTNYFSPARRKKIRQLPKVGQINKRMLVISFISRLIKSKGVWYFYYLTREILRANPYIIVIIGGDGPEYQKLRTKIAKDRLENKVFLLGLLNKEEVAEVLANSDIFIHPSNCSEGIPNIILEAGASGCFVIASNKGGTKEVITNGKTGILIDPDKNIETVKDQLLDLIQNKKKRLMLNKALFQKIKQQFLWNTTVSLYYQLINSLI